MARTPITATVASPGGVQAPTATATDTANGNVVDNSASLVLTVENAGGTDATITFVTTAQVGGYSVEDVTVTVPAGATLVFAHFPADVFGTGLGFTSSAALNVTAYR